MAKSNSVVPLTKDDVPYMREVGRLVADTLIHVSKYIEVGISTEELDDIILTYTEKHGARSACLNYLGYPKASCISVNESYCHGVPNEYRLVEGDILSIDITSTLNGYFADSAKTFTVGNPQAANSELIEISEMAMWKGIEVVRPGVTTEQLGQAIEEFVKSKNYHVFCEMDGHGIGRAFHLEPYISPCRKQTRNHILRAWECITVEPIVSKQPIDPEAYEISGSDITEFCSESKNRSAQFEHTVLVTESGFEVLTLP